MNTAGMAVTGSFGPTVPAGPTQTARTSRAQDAPYIRLAAVVRRHGAYLMSSSIAMAVSGYTSDRAATSLPESVPGLGDGAVMTSVGDEVMVGARRVNVTVSIDVDLDLRHRQKAEAAARAPIAAILADIHPGDGTGRR